MSIVTLSQSDLAAIRTRYIPYDAKHGRKAIARDYDITPNDVTRIAGKRSPWTNRAIASLKEKVAARWTASMIAETMPGMTKRAVLNACQRYGLELNSDPSLHPERQRAGALKAWADPDKRARRVAALRATRGCETVTSPPSPIPPPP